MVSTANPTQVLNHAPAWGATGDTTIILETEWLLRFAYRFESAAICDALTKFLGLANVKTAQPAVVAQAIDLAHQGLDFAEGLHLASSKECTRMATFDNAFIKRAKGGDHLHSERGVNHPAS